jgi:hypothetical protein
MKSAIVVTILVGVVADLHNCNLLAALTWKINLAGK